MSLATRCTDCNTVFRVVQDQLKVSEGWVRCGRCDAVFNALEGCSTSNRAGARRRHHQRQRRSPKRPVRVAAEATGERTSGPSRGGRLPAPRTPSPPPAPASKTEPRRHGPVPRRQAFARETQREPLCQRAPRAGVRRHAHLARRRRTASTSPTRASSTAARREGIAAGDSILEAARRTRRPRAADAGCAREPVARVPARPSATRAGRARARALARAGEALVLALLGRRRRCYRTSS
jgi:predicted Zn finger-like uncharacterized protein